MQPTLKCTLPGPSKRVAECARHGALDTNRSKHDHSGEMLRRRLVVEYALMAEGRTVAEDAESCAADNVVEGDGSDPL